MSRMPRPTLILPRFRTILFPKLSVLDHGLLAFLLALGGCVSPPDRVEVDSGIELPAAWTTLVESGSVSNEWWLSFDEPTLVGLIEQAWTNNPSLWAAAARLDAASAQARIAGASLTPSLGFGFDASRRQQNFIGLPIPGSGSEVLTTRSTSFGVSLNTVWEVDIWGRVRAGQRAALAEVQASAAEVRGLYLSLAAQTIKAWLAAVEAERQVDLARRTVVNYRDTVEKVRSRYERGLRSPLDLRLALTSMANTEVLLALREQQLDAALRQLEILVGRYPSGTPLMAAGLPEVPGEVPAGLPSDLLERRPDLAAAERRLAAEDQRIWEARAARFPQITLTASGGTSTSRLVDLVSRDFLVWSWAVNLAQPILEGGRLKAGEDLAQARRHEALAGYVGVMLQAFAEVESALAAEGWLRAREEQARSASSQAKAAARLAEDRYGYGLEDFITLLEAQRRELETESEAIAVRRQRLETRVDLHLALGGGFP